MTVVIVAGDQHDLIPPSDIKALLFDWDGTLFDNHLANYRSLRDALAGHGVTITQEWFEQHAGLSMSDMITTAATESSASFDLQRVVADRDRIAERHLDQMRPNTELHSLIQHARGVLAMGIVTGSPLSSIEIALRAYGLADAMGVVVTRDQLSRGKPHPDGYRLACRRLDVDPALVQVYEDSDEGIVAAVDTGVARVIDMRIAVAQRDVRN